MNRRAQAFGRFTALFWFLVCLLVVSIFVPALVSPFADVTQPDKGSSIYPVVGFFTSTAGHLAVPVYYLFPQVIKDYYNSSWVSFTYLPDVISLPLFLSMFVFLAYVVITLVPTVGG